MGRIKEIVNSLKNKYQIHSLENDTNKIIQDLEYLDDIGEIKTLEELDKTYKKIEWLQMLETNKHERRIQNINQRVSYFTDDAVRSANGDSGIIPKTNANSKLSFSEAVEKARKTRDEESNTRTY